MYRKWRPQKFAEVVGQRHVVLTLQRALAQGRVSHAYLFAGPRGTGKTTVARILAKAINCRRGPAPEPCLDCDLCRAIAAGSCLDVVEMDAASNRGVDEIRHLRENVGLAPAQGRARVYIVDEVHMLTTEAFNALLKTLEEPPRHVVFVLATTEPHRLPLTIASRCQRFEFRRLATAEVVERLREVARQEGIPATEEALGAVARYAEGSLRDAVSLLDQLVAYAGEEITQETVWAVLGRAPVDLLRGMGQALAEGDAARLLELVEQASLQGLDMRQLLRDLAAYLRDLSVLATCGEGATLLYLPPGEAGRAREDAASLAPERWWDLATGVARAEGEVRWTSQPRLALELALLRLVADRLPSPVQPSGAVAQPVALPSPGGQAQPAADGTGPGRQQLPARPAGAVAMGGPEARPAAPEGTRPGEGAPAPTLPVPVVWEKLLTVLDRARGRSKLAAAYLREGRPLGWEGRRLIVGFGSEYAYHREQVERAYRSLVEQALAGLVGCECRLVCRELREDEVGQGEREVSAALAAPGNGGEGGSGKGPSGEPHPGTDGERGAGTRRERGGETPVGEPVAGDDVVQRLARELGGYILDLEGEDVP